MDDDYRVYDVDGGYSDYYGTSYYDERSAVWLDYHTVTPSISGAPSLASSTAASAASSRASSTALSRATRTTTTTTTTEDYSWPARERGTPPTLPSLSDLQQTIGSEIDRYFTTSSTIALEPLLGWNLFSPPTTTTAFSPIDNFTDTVNATAASAGSGPPPPYPVPVIVLICLFLGLISLATAVGNIFVISAILTEKSLQSVANYLIMSLAVSDFLVATTVMPFALALEASRGQWIFGAYVCDMWTIFDVLCCTASILHLVSIAIDRYWAITSVQYIQNRTSKRIGLMLLIVWIVASTIAILPMLFFKDAQEFANRIAQNECSISDDKAFRVGGGLFAFWMPLFAILLIYCIGVGALSDSRCWSTKLSTKLRGIGVLVFFWLSGYVIELETLDTHKKKIWKAAKSRIRKKDFKAHGGAGGVEKLPLHQRLLARLRRPSNLSVSSFPEASSSTPNPPPKDAALQQYATSVQHQQQQQLLSNHDDNNQPAAVSGGSNTFNSLAVTPGGGDSSGNSSSSNNRYRHSPRVSDALLSNSNYASQTAPASSSSDASSTLLQHAQQQQQQQPNHVDTKRTYSSATVMSSTTHPYQQPLADWVSRLSSMEEDQDFRKALLMQPVKPPANGRVVSDTKHSANNGLNSCLPVNETRTFVDNNGDGGGELALTGAPVIVLRRSILVFRAEELNDARLASSPLVVNELTPACIRKKHGSKPPSTTTTTTTTTLSTTTQQSTAPPVTTATNIAAEEQNKAVIIAEQQLVASNDGKQTHQAQNEATGPKSGVASYNFNSASISHTAATAPEANFSVRTTTVLASQPAHSTPKLQSTTATPRRRSLTSSDNSSLTGQPQQQHTQPVVAAGGGGSSSNSKLTPNHNSHGRKSAASGGAGGGGGGKRNSTNNSNAPPGGRKQDSKEYQAKQKEKKAAKTLAIITFCFCICWIGFFTLQLAEPFCGHDGCSWSSPILFSIFNWLGYSNSMLNPILYTIFSPDFRRAFKRILLGRKAVQQQSRHLRR